MNGLRARWLPVLGLPVLAGVMAAGLLATGTAFSAGEPMPAAKPLVLEEKRFPTGMLYTLVIPADAPYRVTPALSPTLARVDAPVWQDKKPLAVINAGFFDMNNGLTTSFVFSNGMLAADPRKTASLVENESLRKYLPKIFNRTEFRTYLCREQGQYLPRYDIVVHAAPIPEDCLLQDSVGAGPALLPTVAGVEEGFVDYNAQGKVIRDPIGVCARNARSVVGLTQQGDVILMLGAQLPGQPPGKGFTLDEMARLLKARGAVKAMGLDGGGSSSLLFQGKPYFGKLDKNGQPEKRAVKSVLLVTPR